LVKILDFFIREIGGNMGQKDAPRKGEEDMTPKCVHSDNGTCGFMYYNNRWEVYIWRPMRTTP
jgi:hypothetical protein